MLAVAENATRAADAQDGIAVSQGESSSLLSCTVPTTAALLRTEKNSYPYGTERKDKSQAPGLKVGLELLTYVHGAFGASGIWDEYRRVI